MTSTIKQLYDHYLQENPTKTVSWGYIPCFENFLREINNKIRHRSLCVEKTSTCTIGYSGFSKNPKIRPMYCRLL